LAIVPSSYYEKETKMTQTKHFRLITAQPNIDVTASDDGELIEVHYTTKSGYQDTMTGKECHLLKYMNPELYQNVMVWLDELRRKHHEKV